MLALIRAAVARNGYPPTFSQLAGVLDINKNAVQEHLKVLRRKGAVSWSPGEARTLRVLITEEDEEDDEPEFYGDDE